MNAIDWTAVNRLLKQLIRVDLLLHDACSAKVRLHSVCLWTYISAVVTANACQFINEHLQAQPSFVAAALARSSHQCHVHHCHATRPLSTRTHLIALETGVREWVDCISRKANNCIICSSSLRMLQRLQPEHRWGLHERFAMS